MPWSVTLMTLAFVSAVVKDDAYLQQTSDVTPPPVARQRRPAAVQALPHAGVLRQALPVLNLNRHQVRRHVRAGLQSGKEARCARAQRQARLQPPRLLAHRHPQSEVDSRAAPG
ncbi:hypothetical protein PF003_g40368 [Phytophthora fragariae]|nr:hypothetical protein PF003_g40368 [Phytophthora fragariae]